MAINYAEKGSGLHAAISAAGHRLEQLDGEWRSSNDAAVQAIIDGYTVEQARDVKKAEISARATALRNRVIAGYSAGELASWSLKLAEAKAYADENSVCPMLALEAQTRGVDLAALVDRVMDNAVLFSGAEATIAGVEGMHRDSIDACTSFGDIEAYDFSTGWPEV